MAEVTTTTPIETDEERERRLAAEAASSAMSPRDRLLSIAATNSPSAPARREEDAGPAPRLDRIGPIGAESAPPVGTASARLQPIAPAAPPVGSSAWEQDRIQKIEDQKAHPWGTPGNHDSFGGRLAHIAAKVGNIAGDIVAPGVMANIPGTDMHRAVEENQDIRRLGEAQTRENTAANTASESRLRNIQGENLESEIKTREGKNDQSLVSDTQGNITGWKDKSGALHSLDEPGTPQSIKDIAADTQNKQVPKFEKSENGDIVALKTDKDGKTSSEVVYKGDPKVKTETKQVMVGGKLHEVVFDVTPNSPSMGKQLADLGETKEPGAGIVGTLTPLIDPGTGKVVGTFNNKTGEFKEAKPGTAPPNATTTAAARMENTKTNQFTTQFEKPATDIEQNFKKFQAAYHDYQNNPKTGAASMVALAQHLGSTFGSVKGAQMGENMINEHKNAIGFLDSIGRYADQLASGQQLSKEQWKEFNDLISNTRQIQWETTVKEAARRNQKIDFLPSDVQINMQDDSGKVRHVPGNRVQEYLDKGAKLAE